MEETYEPQDGRRDEFDTAVIRPQMDNADVTFRGRNFDAARLAKIKKALRTFHSLELMAVNIYKYQIGKAPSDLNRQLIAAMCNEMTHVQDFQIALCEYGFSPSTFRWAWWMVGIVFGLGSRVMGKKMILKTGIWVESKAVSHYSELLGDVNWDNHSRRMIEKDQADEQHHIRTWQKLLKKI